MRDTVKIGPVALVWGAAQFDELVRAKVDTIF
jgi:hypothetical protein